MIIEFLVEDSSGADFLKVFMEKYILEKPEVNIEYTIHPYKGIGGFSRGPNAQNIKSKQLLCDLPKRLKALNVKLQGVENACIFVVLDNDARNTENFQQELDNLLAINSISIDSVFCIAIEEMEAWLLGDCHALQAAYPKLADRIASKLPNYQQDSICGTWEFLADILTKGGIGKFRKDNPSAHDVGIKKAEWAKNIGKHLDIRENKSPSFQHMLNALDQRRNAAI